MIWNEWPIEEREITDDLVKKIGFIRPTITQNYWFNLETNQITDEFPLHLDAIPLIGYVDDKEKEFFQQIFQHQENAYLHDQYADEAAPALNIEEKRRLLDGNRVQGQSDRNLNGAYPNVPITNEQRLKNWLNEFQGKPNEFDTISCTRLCSWLPVRMPPQFNYTGAIMVNCAIQGLLHSFARHSNQWRNYILNFDEVVQPVSVLEPYFNPIVGAGKMAASRNSLNALIRAIESLSDQTFIEVQTGLNEIQMMLYRFIRENINYENYQGEGTNPQGKQQVYFKVTNRKDGEDIMVVCVSDQLFPPEIVFQDNRPIRLIITIYFISWSEHLGLLVTKLY